MEHCEEFNPDVIIIDPWNRVASGDTQQDYSEAFENILRSMPNDPPAVIIIAHTKKPKDSEKKIGRETLHELSGSHILGSAPVSVFVMNAASNDPEDDRIVWQNPKNNDGAMSKAKARGIAATVCFIRVKTLTGMSTQLVLTSGTGSLETILRHCSNPVTAK